MGARQEGARQMGTEFNSVPEDSPEDSPGASPGDPPVPPPVAVSSELVA